MAQIEEEHKLIQLEIKYTTEIHKNVPIDLNGTVLKFQETLQELLKVPIQKQKIMIKGSLLKQDQDLSKLNLKNGQQIMVMGAREEHLLNLKQGKKIFEEDLTPEQKAILLKQKAGIVLPIGLVNQGNTCYMNASIQILRRVNELNEYVKNNAKQGQGPSVKLFNALSDVFQQLERKGESFKPFNFLSILFQLYPGFAQRENHMSFKQQDADECFQNILQTIEPLTTYENEEGQQKNLVKELFEIELKSTIENQDLPDEPKKVSIEKGKKLMCIIDNQSRPVNTLIEGITVSLEEQLQKISEIDQQTHIYKKTQKIFKLPSYLLCQMVRFFWKQGVQGKEGVKAKILRNVAFPKTLDLFDFCAPELQEQLLAGREYEKKKLLEMAAKETDELEQFKKDLEASGKMIPDDTREIYKLFKAKKQQEEIKNHDDQLYRKHGLGLVTGNYQLIGVLTHTGREADSGHYMAWVHHSGDNWILYDDEKTFEKKIEQIMELRGGGDWHMGYYLLYRRLEIE
ncbi:unnamed protein product [Paramecium primaurelia]|uniref:Ubiquitin carboxyl-terminal hydrolase n=1 Tax=Paramecium primaurelia TaxID=5886 RepID=A0A8S1PH62_PARPR|nr:unnamed protein product [Paramecium primaurelia]